MGFELRFRDGQPLAAFAATAIEDFLPAFGTHARKKAVLIATFAF